MIVVLLRMPSSQTPARKRADYFTQLGCAQEVGRLSADRLKFTGAARQGQVWGDVLCLQLVS